MPSLQMIKLRSDRFKNFLYYSNNICTKFIEQLFEDLKTKGSRLGHEGGDSGEEDQNSDPEVGSILLFFTLLWHSLA